VQLGPPTLRFICPIGAPKVRQLEEWLHRSNSAERGQIAYKFHEIVLCVSLEAAESSKHTKDRIQDGGWRPNFYYTHTDIFGTAKARDFKFGVCIDYEEYFRRRAKTRSKWTWPSLSDLDFKFTDLCEMAKAKGLSRRQTVRMENKRYESSSKGDKI